MVERKRFENYRPSRPKKEEKKKRSYLGVQEAYWSTIQFPIPAWQPGQLHAPAPNLLRPHPRRHEYRCGTKG
ncbi:hypothetical protein Y1Q_0021504 [Alligator mississippiensis]|uniref:Uncharacterized protein n=1 Tax=Alligator mississippiensis TaxID=8496 RepID=A0A151PA11_ALLMI|nr:hypothetical protein Y1Q_0021504 [Alligator mississippiensis]